MGYILIYIYIFQMLAAAASAYSETEDASDLDIDIVCNIEMANCWGLLAVIVFLIYIFFPDVSCTHINTRSKELQPHSP